MHFCCASFDYRPPAGFQNAFCTVPTHDASADKLGRYVTLFYYSKFYEVIDSLILALKGKPVGNLQSYHHVSGNARATVL